MDPEGICAELLWTEGKLTGIAGDGMGPRVGLVKAGRGNQHIRQVVVLVKGPVAEGVFAFLLRVHLLGDDPGAVWAAFQVFADRRVGGPPADEGQVAVEAFGGVVVAVGLVVVEPAGGGHVFGRVGPAVRPIDEGFESLLEGRHIGDSRMASGSIGN